MRSPRSPPAGTLEEERKMSVQDDRPDEIDDDTAIAEDLEVDEDAEHVTGGRGGGSGKANFS
jgi:hypothetical protein